MKFMKQYKEILNSVKEMPFSIRLEYFLNEYYRNEAIALGESIENINSNPLTSKKLEEKSYSTNGIRIQKESVYKYLKGKSMPKEETLERLAELLYAPIENLREDLGRYYRGISKIRHKIDGEKFDDNFLDKNGKLSLYGDYEFDGHEFIDDCSIEDKNENLDKLLKEDISDSFNKMDLLSCYKLIKYYNAYINIHDDVWEFLCNFTLLNSKGKEKLKKYISTFSTKIEFQLENINIFSKYIPLFVEIRDLKEDDFQNSFKQEYCKFKTDEQAKNYYKEDLFNKLKNESLGTVERFSKQMEPIVTMEVEDWNIVISYFLLTKFSFYIPSEEQHMLLTISNELVEDIRYCDKNN